MLLGAMLRKKILHIGKLDKFTSPFVEMINEHFEASRHEFIFFRGSVSFSRSPFSNLTVMEDGLRNRLVHYANLIYAMHRAEKIILHGMFQLRTIQLLWAMPWLLKKCYWIIWGGDLYVPAPIKEAKRWRRKEFFRRAVIRKMGYLVTGNAGDFALARSRYGAKGAQVDCVCYPSNTFSGAPKPRANKGDTLGILVGNSATATNRHFYVFEKLAPYKDRNIVIYCPLSYGDRAYAEAVADKGTAMFGEKFVPLFDFLPYEQYLDVLSDIDIAVFAHERQQAFGNIVALLGMGRKVFITRKSTLWNYFRGKGLRVFDVESLDLVPLKPDLGASNSRVVRQEYAPDALLRSLDRLFG